MTTKNIIQKGDIAKYQIKIQRDDFDVERDDFSVTLRWGIASPDSMKIEKTDMYHDEEWNVYFMFETSGMLGKVTAECEYKVPDSDAQGGYRTSVDRQILCLVADNATAKLPKCPVLGERYVTYTRTFRSDANSLYAIVRVQPEIVASSDGEPLRVRKHNLK